MPEEKKHQNPEPEEQAGEPSAPESKKTAWLFSGKWFWRAVVVLAVLTVVLQAGGWIYYYANSSGKASQTPEIGLGQYQFSGAPPIGGRVAQAQFSLYVTLLKGLDKTGRETLADHKYRVQQDVEQLLRQVHGGDFEDPDLGGLKIQIREKIDKAVGSRVVSDVIITDLKLTLAGPSEHSSVAKNTPVSTIPVPLESRSPAK